MRNTIIKVFFSLTVLQIASQGNNIQALSCQKENLKKTINFLIQIIKKAHDKKCGCGI